MEVAEHCALLGYYAACSVIPHRRFGATYWSHLQGRPETAVMNYRYTLRNIAEECSSHLLCGRSLKSRVEIAGLSEILLSVCKMARSHVTEDHNLHNLRR